MRQRIRQRINGLRDNAARINATRIAEFVKAHRRQIPIIVVAIIVLVLIWNFVLALPSVRAIMLGGELHASGTIEAEPVSVTADVGGRVLKILAKEGDRVDAGMIVVLLDSESAAADVARAQAALAEAQARRDLAKNGARAEDKAQADATLAQAMAARDGAKRAWDDARAILENPQELNAKIDRARSEVALAEQQIEAVKAQQAQAEALRSKYHGRGSDLEKTFYASFDLQVQAAQEYIVAAMAQRGGAVTFLNDLLAIREHPLDLQIQVHQAEARYREADAAAQIAQAARDLVYAGATKEDLAIAQAAVAQAQAAANAAQARLDKLSLRAPAAGRISKRSIDIGQVIAPGTAAMTIIDTNRLTLTVFVPEDRLGRIRPGQSARVSVDSFPGRTFNGRVTFISPQAEFTPKNVQTVEGRASQVFAVKIRLDNSENLLKSGLPADAAIVP